MADEAGCQPTGTGGFNRVVSNLFSGNRQTLTLPYRHTRRLRAVHPDEGAVARLGQELRIDERAQQGIAHVAFKTPETLRLCRGQSKSGHLDVLALYSLQHFIYPHGIPTSWQSWGLARYSR
jgi:hypothetical protein